MNKAILFGLIAGLPQVVLANEAPAPNPMGSGIMFVLIIVMMYFLLIRPQSKRAKAHRDLISKVEKGDEVVTTGGLVGKISKINEQFIIITVADGVNLTVQRQAISTALPKGTLKSV